MSTYSENAVFITQWIRFCVCVWTTSKNKNPFSLGFCKIHLHRQNFLLDRFVKIISLNLKAMSGELLSLLPNVTRSNTLLFEVFKFFLGGEDVIYSLCYILKQSF